ncbi:RadC family protein [Pacificoceanicola onchidii]|uniref:RadC family protein n=1 Tax=Pacificoceanicola onchidii TaxID=2562685 RepID=UPI0010A6AD64|nr:DNA repair protein RadC [Pacificoceanicola onchidii]
MQGLRDLEARIPPPDIDARPAFQPSHQHSDRLSPKNAAGGGLITDDRGNTRPHYHGHRERLRQRFLQGGHEAMPEYEVLELLLFNAIPRIDVKPLAKRLLAEFGDLSGVIAASEHRILQVQGADRWVFLQLRIAEAMAHRMTKAKTLERDLLSSWDALIDYCRTAMAHRDTEQFRILYLDRKNKLIADEKQADGTVDHVPVYPREVAKRSLELNATALILVHNHPSGDTTPSSADIDMTEQIVSAVGVIGVTVHDHVIIGKETEYSFRANGFI